MATGDPFLGDTFVVNWDPTEPAGTAFDIHDEAQTFKVSRAKDKIKAGTRGNPKFTLAGTSNDTASMSGLDVEDGAPVLALKPGDKGVLTWYEEGSGSGMRKNVVDAQVTSMTPVDLNFEDVSKFDINWDLTSDIVTTLVAP